MRKDPNFRDNSDEREASTTAFICPRTTAGSAAAEACNDADDDLASDNLRDPAAAATDEAGATARSVEENENEASATGATPIRLTVAATDEHPPLLLLIPCSSEFIG